MPSGVQTCALDRKSTRLNSSHGSISYAVFCFKKNDNEAHENNAVPEGHLERPLLGVRHQGARCPGGAHFFEHADVVGSEGLFFVFFLNGGPPGSPALPPPAAPPRS